MRSILPATALSAALIAYALFWFRLAAELPRGLEAFAQDLRAQGWGVAYEAPVTRGFPFGLKVEVANFMLARPTPGRGLAWHTESLTLTMRPWNPSRLVARAGGRQRLILDGAPWSGGAEQALAGLRLVDGALESASLDLTGLRLAGPGGAEMEAARLHVRLDRNHPGESTGGPPQKDGGPPQTNDEPPQTNDEPPQTDIQVRAEGILLPGAPAPLGPRIRRFSLGLSHPTIAEGSLVWFERGGPLEVAQLVLDWPPLAANGQGTLALDGSGRPAGRVEITISGYSALVGALAARGRLSAAEAALAQAALAVLAAGQGNGGALKVAATLSGGGLFLGPVRLADLPMFK